MKLSQLLNQLLAETPLNVVLNLDPYLPLPKDLAQSNIYTVIKDSVEKAASGILSAHGACVFAEFLAQLCTGIVQMFTNDIDAGVTALHMVFTRIVLGDVTVATIPLPLLPGHQDYSIPVNVKEFFRLTSLPDWNVFNQLLPQIRLGIQTAFKQAESL